MHKRQDALKDLDREEAGAIAQSFVTFIYSVSSESGALGLSSKSLIALLAQQ